MKYLNTSPAALDWARSLSISWKKIKQTTEKMPVLMTGTKTLEVTKPATFLVLNNLNTKPATKPAIVHFNKQAITVPTGLYCINKPIVDGENSVIMPLKKPNTAPENGPYNTAAKTMATNEMLILTGPNCK